MHFFSNLFLE